MLFKRKYLLIAFLANAFFQKSSTIPIQMMCMDEIISTHFISGQVIVFSLPTIVPEIKQRYLKSSAYSFDEDIMINNLLYEVNNKIRWPVVISSESVEEMLEVPQPQHGYIIFLVSDDDMTIIENLENHISNLNTGFSFNRKGKFIIFVNDRQLEDSKTLSRDILKTIWDMEKILNAIVIIPTYEKAVDSPQYDIYSLLPYESEKCGKGENIILLDRCNYRGKLSRNDLFPQKIPQDLHGCKLIVTTMQNKPYVMRTETYTEDGSVIEHYNGLDMVFLMYVSEAINFRVEFQETNATSTPAFYSRSLEYLLDKRTDVSIGLFVLAPHFLSFGDPTIPYIFSSLDWYVPCARPNPKTGRVMDVFTDSVWMVVFLVLFQAAFLFRLFGCSEMESEVYKSFSDCLMNTWAIFLASSTSHPSTNEFRCFFLVFVCYCFAMTTIFQSFFTTFIIEPGFEKQIESIEDMNKRKIYFAQHRAAETLATLTSSTLMNGIKYNERCEDYTTCMEISIKYQNISIISEKYMMEFMSSYLANSATTKVCCTFISVVTGGICMYFPKGDPLVDTFNLYIQRCLENGFLVRYWSLLSRRKINYHQEEPNDSYSSYTRFSLFHLHYYFLTMLVGYGFSFVLLLVECVCNFFWKNYEL
ncbi:Ionotropic receptor 746 [Blattella germanica]|nr:Ionotropic receptor 746 [Blattella germanica]